MLPGPIQFLCYYLTLTLAVPAVITKEPSMLLNFTPCRLSDPNLNLCLWKALDKAMPDIIRGVPQLGLPRIDPLHVQSLEASKSDGQSQITFKFRDMNLYNLRSSAINAINFDPINYKCFIGIQARDPIILKGFYELNGFLFMLPVSGKGKCEISMDHYKTNLTMQFQKITRNGEYYLEPVHFSQTMSTSRMHFKFHNLFNGNKVLGDTVNNVVNQNWKELLRDFKPMIMKMIEPFFISYAYGFFPKSAHGRLSAGLTVMNKFEK